MALVPWYIHTVSENGVRMAWIRNAQDLDTTVETDIPLGRDYFYANLFADKVYRVTFNRSDGQRFTFDIPPNTTETPVRVSAAFNNFSGYYTFGLI